MLTKEKLLRLFVRCYGPLRFLLALLSIAVLVLVLVESENVVKLEDHRDQVAPLFDFFFLGFLIWLCASFVTKMSMTTEDGYPPAAVIAILFWVIVTVVNSMAGPVAEYSNEGTARVVVYLFLYSWFIIDLLELVYLDLKWKYGY